MSWCWVVCDWLLVRLDALVRVSSLARAFSLIQTRY